MTFFKENSHKILTKLNKTFFKIYNFKAIKVLSQFHDIIYLMNKVSIS